MRILQLDETVQAYQFTHAHEWVGMNNIIIMQLHCSNEFYRKKTERPCSLKREIWHTHIARLGLTGRILYKPMSDETVPKKPTQKFVKCPAHRKPLGNQCTAFMRSERVWTTVNMATKRWCLRTRIRVLLLPVCWSSKVTLRFSPAVADPSLDTRLGEWIPSSFSSLLILRILAIACRSEMSRDTPHRTTPMVQNHCDWTKGRRWLSAAHAMCSRG